MQPQEPPKQTLKTEPKFCRCRVCHVHFYGETIEATRQACHRHGVEEHPEWHDICYCPD